MKHFIYDLKNTNYYNYILHYFFIFGIILWYIPLEYPNYSFSHISAFYRIITAIIISVFFSICSIIPWINLICVILMSVSCCYISYTLGLYRLLTYNDTYFWLIEFAIFFSSFFFSKGRINKNHHDLIYFPNNKIQDKVYNSSRITPPVTNNKSGGNDLPKSICNLSSTGTKVNHKFENINLYDKKGSIVFQNLKKDILNTDSLTLLKTYSIFTPEFIDKSERKVKGFEGEATILDQLNTLNLDNSICLHNACFKNSDVTAREIDFVLITPYAIFIIESKYRTCDTVSFNKYNYFEYPNKKETTYENPLFQLLAQKNYLQELLINNEYLVPIYEFLVFSGTPDIIVEQPIPINVKHICKCNELCQLLKDTCKNLEKKIKYQDVVKISDLINEQCTFPKQLFLPKQEDYTNTSFFHLAECHSHLPMIPRHYLENGKDKFFLICPETKLLKTGNWTCKTMPLEINSD